MQKVAISLYHVDIVSFGLCRRSQMLRKEQFKQCWPDDSGHYLLKTWEKLLCARTFLAQLKNETIVKSASEGGGVLCAIMENLYCVTTDLLDQSAFLRIVSYVNSHLSSDVCKPRILTQDPKSGISLLLCVVLSN